MTGGYSGSSMFYMVAIFLGVYVIGMGVYLIVQKIQRINEKKRDGRFGED